MDREIIFATVIAVAGMLGFAGLFLGSDPSTPSERPIYAPDDIRYRLQQADLKKPKHKGSATSTTAATPSDTGSSSSGSDSDSGDDSNEEPSVTDHPPEEEPPLE